MSNKQSKNDPLGSRMKDQYENRTRYYLPRRTYTIIRCDGAHFHTFTKGMNRPFDHQFMNAMDKAAIALCDEIPGAKFAYVQSDEISVLVTDFDKDQTQAWFDGNIQKIVSTSAAVASVNFNNAEPRKYCETNKTILGTFDARVFTIADFVEVENYFLWRIKDCERNSLQSLAQSLYSHKELHEKKASDLQEMCFQKGQNWNNLLPYYKRGRIVRKDDSGWKIDINIPKFSENKEYYSDLIPRIR